MTLPELARQLGLDPDYLRQLTRAHDLMPGHRSGARYVLEEDDAERIAAHPAVRLAAAGRRERATERPELTNGEDP